MDRWQNFRTLDLGDWHNIERRIGVRVPTEGIEVGWVPSPDVIDLRDEGFIGRVVEVSVTGAAIDASNALPVDLESRASVRFGGTESTVTVRHVSPTGEPGVTRYGIEWARLEDPLRQLVYGVVADARAATA
jgi:hypothetical protein